MHRAELQKSTITGKSSFLNARRIIRRFELLGLAARLQRVTWSRCLRRRLTLESDAIFRGFEVAPKDIAQNGRGARSKCVAYSEQSCETWYKAPSLLGQCSKTPASWHRSSKHFTGNKLLNAPYRFLGQCGCPFRPEPYSENSRIEYPHRTS